MTSDPVLLMWLVVALSWLAAVLLAAMPMECPEDCPVCRDIRRKRKDDAAAAQAKRSDEYWNGRRPKP